MNSTLYNLKALQETDDQIKQSHKVLVESQAQVAEASAKLKSLESCLTETHNDLSGMQLKHRELESKLVDLTIKQKNNEARQMNIKSDHEYAALAKEAEFLNSNINEFEDETLALLDNIEKRAAQASKLEISVTRETAAYNSFAAKTALAQKAGHEILSSLASRREEIAAALPQLQLRQYDELFKNKGGRAVTATVDGLCQACRLGFPPQLSNELQRNEKILTCPNCGRIIFWRDHPDFLESKPDQTES